MIHEHYPKSIIFFFLLSYIFHPQAALAESSDFSEQHTIRYQVLSGSSCQVNHSVILTNKFSQIYPTEYVFTTDQDHLSEIKAVSNGQTTTSSPTSTQPLRLQIPINHSIPGIGQTNSIEISYHINSCLVTKGQTKELDIPLPDTSLNPRLDIELPLGLGGLIYSSLTPKQDQVTPYLRHLQYDRFPDNQKRLLLTFGESQLFDFDLTYYLSNPSTQAVHQSIPLPPDTNSQTIIFKQIEPRPLLISLDPDGNYLADYRLLPQQNITVSVKGQAQIHPPVPTNHSDQDLSAYLRDDPLWPITDPQIRQISATLQSPKSIFDFVTKKLDYNYLKINSPQRLGAITALQNPQDSLCTEYSDLFVTLARAKNIPAREIQGFAYSTNSRLRPTNPNSDILHSWVEWFDSTSSQWRQVDPTWTDTSHGLDYFHQLDLNHFALVIHGQDSQAPFPPGSYPPPNSSGPTVNISFSQTAFDHPTPEPLTTSITKTGLLSYQLIITNPNLNSLRNLHLTSPRTTHQSDLLPPLGQITIPINFNPTTDWLPQNRLLQLDLTYTSIGQPSQQHLSLPNPFHFQTILTLILSTIFILSLLGIILSRSTHH